MDLEDIQDMEFELDGAPMAFDASPRYYANCQELATEAGFSYETLSKTMATSDAWRRRTENRPCFVHCTFSALFSSVN